MNKENKIARGKQIISDMKSVVYNYYAKHRKDKSTKSQRISVTIAPSFIL